MTIIFAFASVPVLFALGATADYGFAVKTRARMNAAADAAALAAVTPYQMTQLSSVSQLVAQQMFIAQASNLPRTTFDPTNPLNLNVTVADTTVNSQRVRTATVKYSALSQTAFTNIIRMPTIGIGGSSTATASTSPNIDFYLMLDTSPSMAIPSSTTGINWMVAHTTSQGGGCAFACHEKTPANDNLGNPGGIDNYTLARNNSITLRMDLVSQAVSNLVDTAQITSASTGAAYRMAGYTFDVAVGLPMPLQTPTATTKTQASAIQMLLVDYENVLNGVSNSDQDTNYDTAFTRLNKDMTTAGAGNGTNAVGDKPQQVLMIVTDGVADESWSSKRIYLPLGGTTNLSADSTDWCTTIKSNANVRIAVLYLTYNPLPSNSWYTTYIAPEQNDIPVTLKNCASPGLFFQVDTGGDVSSAMSTLFQSAVKSARLSN